MHTNYDKLYNHIHSTRNLGNQTKEYQTLPTSPNLGTLYDCSKTRRNGLYTLDEIIFCKRTANHDKVEKLRGDVYSLYEQTKEITLALCSYRKITYSCDEHFFGNKDKHIIIEELPVNTKECKRAFKRKISPKGQKLIQIGYNTWSTTMPKHRFACY